ncbi:MAG: hypothetical protein EOO45_13910 [Flavobacterium sp.]|nr:MAG: hypothetical protein EOO45_13910 [Flavobacterium sp.]
MGNVAKYINFLWNSTNRHGVHSPFVFGFVDKCIYAKGPNLPFREGYKFNEGISFRKAALLHRTISYFNAQKLLALGDDTSAMTEILRYAGEKQNKKIWFFSPIAPIPGTIDLLYFSYNDRETLLNVFNERLADANPNTICIIDGIYNSTETKQAWSDIKDHHAVTVTVDTYDLGVAFLRKGQAKQHFMIRLSQSPLLNAALGIKKLYGLLD